MSQENVEIVRRLIEAHVKGDAGTASSLMDPMVVLDASRVSEIVGDSQGRDEVVDAVRSYRGAFSEYDFKVEKLQDLGPGVILGVAEESGVGKTSGAEVERTYYVLYSVIDRLVTRMTHFPSEADALNSLGLSSY
jgi:ketosteroid isomerase-like protein